MTNHVAAVMEERVIVIKIKTPKKRENKTMNYVIVDFEMNPLASEYTEEKQICRSEIIEIGAVIMDESFQILGEFKTLVKPQYNDVILKRYETLTGITTEMVYGAPEFKTAYETFVNWCESYGSEYEIHAWSENDYNQLVAEMQLKKYLPQSIKVDELQSFLSGGMSKKDKKKWSEEFASYELTETVKKNLTNWFDFQKEYTEKLGLEKIMSLEKALDYAGIDFEGHMHDALCDAKNTAELFAIVRNEERCKIVLQAVMDALKPKELGSTLGDVIDFAALLAQLG